MCHKVTISYTSFRPKRCISCVVNIPVGVMKPKADVLHCLCLPLVCLWETQHVVGTGADSEDCTLPVVVLERETGFEPATFCMAIIPILMSTQCHIWCSRVVTRTYIWCFPSRLAGASRRSRFLDIVQPSDKIVKGQAHRLPPLYLIYIALLFLFVHHLIGAYSGPSHQPPKLHQFPSSAQDLVLLWVADDTQSEYSCPVVCWRQWATWDIREPLRSGQS